MNRRAALSAFLIAMASVSLAGGGLTKEFRAYKGKVPLSETALLYSIDDRNAEFGQSIVVKVDGQGTGFMGPTRTSARVLPGTHKFLIKAIWDFSSHLGGSTQGISVSSTYRELDMEIEVKDMKPLHVYVVRYRFEGENIVLGVEDLGERATYSPSVFARAAEF